MAAISWGIDLVSTDNAPATIKALREECDIMPYFARRYPDPFDFEDVRITNPQLQVRGVWKKLRVGGERSSKPPSRLAPATFVHKGEVVSSHFGRFLTIRYRLLLRVRRRNSWKSWHLPSGRLGSQSSRPGRQLEKATVMSVHGRSGRLLHAVRRLERQSIPLSGSAGCRNLRLAIRDMVPDPNSNARWICVEFILPWTPSYSSRVYRRGRRRWPDLYLRWTGRSPRPRSQHSGCTRHRGSDMGYPSRKG